MSTPHATPTPDVLADRSASRFPRRVRTVPHPSIKPPVPVRRRSGVVSVLAAAGVFATVLASQPVYGQPPQRGQQSSTAPASAESANVPKTPPKSRDRASETTAVESNVAEPRPADSHEAVTLPSPATSSPAPASAARVAPLRGARSLPSGTRAEPGAASPPEPVRLALRTTTAAPAPSDPGPSAPDARRPTAEPTAVDRAGDRDGDRRRAAPGTRTIIEDEFLIEGKLEKPSAYYILRRSSLDYDWARLDAKFSPLVLESVQDPLF